MFLVVNQAVLGRDSLTNCPCIRSTQTHTNTNTNTHTQNQTQTQPQTQAMADTTTTMSQVVKISFRAYF